MHYGIAFAGSAEISLCGQSVERHGQAMARVKRWPKSAANWAFAMEFGILAAAGR